MSSSSHPVRARRATALALAGTALLLAAGCGADEQGATADPSGPTTVAVPAADFQDATGQEAVVVQARDNTFVGQHVTVSPGTEVTFDNRGRNPHNAVPVEDDAFTEVPTEDLQPGDQVTVAFDEPGDYPYYCTLHGTTTAGMTGTVRVEG
jgi:plastocyanin